MGKTRDLGFLRNIFVMNDTSVTNYVPTARTLTINGTTVDLSADRTFNIATSATLGGLTDATISTLVDNQLLRYNASTSKWVNWTPNYLTGITSSQITAALGFTPYNATNPSGYIAGITSSMVTTALGYTPATNSRTITINGTAYDLSADRSWTVSGSDSTKLPLSGGTLTGALVMASSGTSYIRMGQFPNSTSNTGEAWIGRASDRSTGSMTLQLGGSSNTSFFEIVDYGWTTVTFKAGMNDFSYKGNAIVHAGNISSYTAGSANSVAWTNVSGRPTNVSSFSNDSGYTTNQMSYMGITNTSSSSGYGISLYGGGGNGEMNYGVMFAGTGTFGGHGSVAGSDWATYFTTNAGGTSRGWIFRRAGSANVASISGSGHANFNGDVYSGGNHTIQNTSPTIYLQDTDHRSSMIHCNSNTFYILRGNGTNTTSWATYNGYWPMTINLENNDATFGGSLTAVYDITAYSDARVKKNISTIENALDKVLALRGVTYQRIDVVENLDKRHLGVIAQEVREVLPEVVSENDKGHLNVAYGNLSGLFIEAFKEQNQIIKKQSEEINQLKEIINEFTK